MLESIKNLYVNLNFFKLDLQKKIATFEES